MFDSELNVAVHNLNTAREIDWDRNILPNSTNLLPAYSSSKPWAISIDHSGNYTET